MTVELAAVRLPTSLGWRGRKILRNELGLRGRARSADVPLVGSGAVEPGFEVRLVQESEPGWSRIEVVGAATTVAEAIDTGRMEERLSRAFNGLVVLGVPCSWVRPFGTR